MSDFETRLNRLEEIAELLKNGEIPIDTAATLFEEGMTLSKGLSRELQELEKRIEILTSATEEPTFSLFQEE